MFLLDTRVMCDSDMILGMTIYDVSRVVREIQICWG